MWLVMMRRAFTVFVAETQNSYCVLSMIFPGQNWLLCHIVEDAMKTSWSLFSKSLKNIILIGLEDLI